MERAKLHVNRYIFDTLKQRRTAANTKPTFHRPAMRKPKHEPTV
jgi:hypothetical protein